LIPEVGVGAGADDGCGSLREACRAEEPLWIVFEVSGTIHLRSYLRVSSYKTIDGRGQRVVLAGKGLQLKSCHHVIVCNLVFEGGRGHDVDGIQIKPDSTNIWIDRCTLADYDDGLIDITRQSTDITVSRSFSFPSSYAMQEFVIFDLVPSGMNKPNNQLLHADATSCGTTRRC
jgi:pectate lyase